MSRARTQASVGLAKQAHPERYCPVARCLWHTGGGYCPRHQRDVDNYAGEVLARTDARRTDEDPSRA